MRHASATTTLRTYAHLMEGAAEKAPQAMEDGYLLRVKDA